MRKRQRVIAEIVVHLTDGTTHKGFACSERDILQEVKRFRTQGVQFTDHYLIGEREGEVVHHSYPAGRIVKIVIQNWQGRGEK